VPLRIYNSLTHKKEDFVPVHSGKVTMYCCGPTVYDFLHIGNFRGAVLYNFVRNWLEKSGYAVEFAYNFTDVDDKILNRAQKEGVTARQIAERFIDEFWKDYLALELRPHTHNPRVTEHMPAIIQIVEKLIAKNKAYVVDGEVFFSVSSFPTYGKLSGRKTEDLMAGARVEVDAKKRDPMDFTLWKPAKPGEEFWDSPWGKGRPGWHIECSAMNYALFGEQIDIHGGGLDLIFPHHENEIAQSEGACGKTFAKYWIHNNMITFDGQKMSKSVGNIRTMRSFLEKYPAEIFKFMILACHYRSVLDFSDQTISQTISGLARFYSALLLAEEVAKAAAPTKDEPFEKLLAEVDAKMAKSFDEDFNTAEAIAHLFEVIRTFNGQTRRGGKIDGRAAARAKAFLDFMRSKGQLMALFQQPSAQFLILLDDMLLEQKGLQRSEIQTKVDLRVKARAEKNFAESDRLRNELTALGISVQDTPAGSFWEVQK
jgi:cysteinyl-tRNA synthetase